MVEETMPHNTCTYNGIRLPSGKLYVYIEWTDKWARPQQLSHPGNYSKLWNWGEQADKEGYDLAHAIIKHAFRSTNAPDYMAVRYAPAYALAVLSKLPTDVKPEERPPVPGNNPTLFTITQESVRQWIDDYERQLREEDDIMNRAHQLRPA